MKELYPKYENHSDVLANWGVLLKKKKDNSQKIKKIFQKSIKINKNNHYAQYQLGNIYFDERNWNESK